MSEKTEQPSQKKIRDARERGEVAKSKDFTQAVLTIAMFGYIIGQSGAIVHAITQILVAPFDMFTMDFRQAANTLAQTLLREGIALLMPFLLITVGLGVLAEAMQTGMLIS